VAVDDLPFFADQLEDERHPPRGVFSLAVVFLRLFPLQVSTALLVPSISTRRPVMSSVTFESFA